MSRSMRLLILWALFTVVGTLAPFDFATVSAVHPFALFHDGSHVEDPIHFALNLILFMPLGALLHHEAQRRSLRWPSRLILAGLVGLLFSIAIEFVQVYLPSRDSSLIDVLANTTGGAMGALSERAWGQSVQTRVGRIRARTSPAILAAALVAFMGVALSMSAALQARTSLSNWNSEYPLLIGNERTGDRPWRGRVYSFTITDAATPLALVRRFAAGELIALPGSPIAMFDFNGNPPYRDAARNLPDINRTETANGSPPLKSTGQPWLQTAGPAADIANRLRKTNKFSLRIRCATDDTTQGGPARIVSNSVSPYLRNFTLGQQGADLVVRLRTPQTGDNGVRPETTVPDVFTRSNQPRDILVTYDGANVIGGIAGTDHTFQTELGPAVPIAVFIGSFMPQQVRADQLPVSRMVYFGALFIPPGLFIGLLESTLRRRLIFGGAYLVMASALLEVILALASGRSILWGNVPVVAVVGGLVLVVTVAILSPANSQRSRERRSWAAAESSI